MTSSKFEYLKNQLYYHDLWTLQRFFWQLSRLLESSRQRALDSLERRRYVAVRMRGRNKPRAAARRTDAALEQRSKENAKALVIGPGIRGVVTDGMTGKASVKRGRKSADL
jgi:DNA-binding transcriptional MocR family regulator